VKLLKRVFIRKTIDPTKSARATEPMSFLRTEYLNGAKEGLMSVTA